MVLWRDFVAERVTDHRKINVAGRKQLEKRKNDRKRGSRLRGDWNRGHGSSDSRGPENETQWQLGTGQRWLVRNRSLFNLITQSWMRSIIIVIDSLRLPQIWKRHSIVDPCLALSQKGKLRKTEETYGSLLAILISSERIWLFLVNENASIFCKL